MNVDCMKCGSEKYYVKTAIFPEKNPGLKINLGTYYLKICSQCGFVEMYAAEIVDNEREKNVELKPEY
ncbi:MAG: hypothetical protein ACRC0K_02205 [Fusobacteriaceae bacterium]